MHIPIAEVTAIGYSIPLYVTIGAALFFGEQIKPYHFMALAIGFIGALIIIRPISRSLAWTISSNSCISYFCCILSNGKETFFRESSMVIIGMLSLFVSMIQIPMVLLVWVPPNFFDVMCLGFVAILATIGHYAMTQSFRLTPMTISQPVTYLQLVWATIMGIYLFGDMFDIYVIIGGAMITLSATVIAYLDTRNVSESI